MSDITAWSIPGSDGQAIRGRTHHPPTAPRGSVVLSHGFKGYKDYGFFPRLAEHLAAAGFRTHRFNFSHSGMTDDVATFARPDLFEQDTWGRQIFDLKQVIAEVAAADDLPLVLFGHSRGGLTTLLTAAELERPPAGVVTAAAPADAERLTEEQKTMLRRAGRLASPSGRTGQTLYVGRGWLDEIDGDPDRFNPCQAIARLKSPVLLLHGEDDQTVPADDARRLHAAAHRSDVEVVLIPGANHVFNAPNPMPPGLPPEAATEAMLTQITAFALRCGTKKIAGSQRLPEPQPR